MKLLALLFLFPVLPCLAQHIETDSLDKKSPHLIIMTGIGLQWFDELYKLSTVSIERPTSHNWNYGLEGIFYYGHDLGTYKGILVSGFEIGAYGKYFLHGRFSGHPSGLYFGPEIRLGRRNFKDQTGIEFSPDNPFVQYPEFVTKILVRCGIQWQFKHASLELATPFGLETVHSYYSAEFVMIPTLQLGIGF